MSLAGYLPNSTDKFFGLLRRLSRQISSKKIKALEKVWTCVRYSLFSLSDGILLSVWCIDAYGRVYYHIDPFNESSSRDSISPSTHSKQTTDQKRKECALLLLSIVCCFRHKKKLTDHTTSPPPKQDNNGVRQKHYQLLTSFFYRCCIGAGGSRTQKCVVMTAIWASFESDKLSTCLAAISRNFLCNGKKEEKTPPQ